MPPCAVAGQLPRQLDPTNLIVLRDSPESAGTGLDRDSVVQAESIVTLTKASVIRRLGRFNDETIQAIDQCVRVSLGLV